MDGETRDGEGPDDLVDGDDPDALKLMMDFLYDGHYEAAPTILSNDDPVDESDQVNQQCSSKPFRRGKKAKWQTLLHPILNQ